MKNTALKEQIKTLNQNHATEVEDLNEDFQSQIQLANIQAQSEAERADQTEQNLEQMKAELVILEQV